MVLKKLKNSKTSFRYNIENTHRSVGTRLSHYVFKKFGNNNLEDENITINLQDLQDNL